VKQPAVYVLASKPYGTLYPRLSRIARGGDESGVEGPQRAGLLIF
jgi:hypothetical protein